MTDMQVKSGMVHVYRLKWITSLLKGGVLLVFVVIAALYLFGFNKKTQVKKVLLTIFDLIEINAFIIFSWAVGTPFQKFLLWINVGKEMTPAF